MIFWIRGEVMDTEASNSKSTIPEGLHKPRPPIPTGTENKSLSKSLMHLQAIAGINSLKMVDSRG